MMNTGTKAGLGIGIIIIAISSGSFFFFEDTFVQQEESKDLTDVSYAGVIDDNRKLLLVGESFPPFTFEENGIPTGIDVEILELALQRVDVPYEIKVIPWARAVKMIEYGSADVLIGAVYSDERNEFAYYTEDQAHAQKKSEVPKSYLTTHSQVFFIRQIYENSLFFESFDQVRDLSYRIGQDVGYSYPDSFSNVGLDITFYNSAEQSFSALINGEIDLYLVNKNVGLWVLKSMDLQNEVTYIDKPVFTSVFLAPFSKTSDYPNLKEIWEQTSGELEKIQESNEARYIYDGYLLRN